jgi:hypothetical protein
MDDTEVSMRSKDITIEDSYFINDKLCLQEAAERIKRYWMLNTNRQTSMKLLPQDLSISKPTRENKNSHERV